MAHEKKIKQFAQEAGYEPLDGRCIIVQPAPNNLSDKIVSFLNLSWNAICAYSKRAKTS